MTDCLRGKPKDFCQNDSILIVHYLMLVSRLFTVMTGKRTSTTLGITLRTDEKKGMGNYSCLLIQNQRFIQSLVR